MGTKMARIEQIFIASGTVLDFELAVFQIGAVYLVRARRHCCFLVAHGVAPS
jgi:hypothetical protein